MGGRGVAMSVKYAWASQGHLLERIPLLQLLYRRFPKGYPVLFILLGAALGMVLF